MGGATRIVSLTHNPVERDSRAFKVAASLDRLGYESVVLEGEPSAMDADRLSFELIALRERGPSGDGGGAPPAAAPAGRPRLPNTVRRRLRSILQPLLMLAQMARENIALIRRLPRADAYYLHSALQFPAAYVRARRGRARLIYDAHDANWAMDASDGDEQLAGTTLRAMERIDRICARRVDAFLTVGAGLAGLLDEHLDRRPVVVRNCHDFRLDEDSPGDVRAAAGLPADAFLLVMTGAPKPGDTVDRALEALRDLPDEVHLALVGRGQEARRPAVRRAGLEHRVHLLDAVPPTQVASFIRTADASPILYHALHEMYLHSLPNRFFHAVAAGLPILYPPLPEIKALCEEHQLGLEIDPEDAASIAGGIRTLLDDQELRARLAANARTARSVLSWEHEERKLAHLVEGAFSGPRS